MRPRTHRPLSMLKYDPVGMYAFTFADEFVWEGEVQAGRSEGSKGRGRNIPWEA